ncbi:MAG TPA: Flp pilus assembly protein CpaB [Bryobacteraceae bacterium]|nr:Flp pilus assembly protein CpaB [Bryobacteraceae bacterium]
MTKRLIAVLVFAVIVAGAASFLLYRVLERTLARTQQPRQAVKVIVAARSLQVGEMIKDYDLKEETWTQPPHGSVINDRQKLVGRGVRYPILQGEPFLEERLAPEGAGAGLPAMIPAGMRAVAIPVNNVTGVAGFVTPGTRVDILVMGNPPDAPPSVGTLSKTLLQNIEVLSAGTQIQRDTEGKPIQVPVVNLLVTPEQAEIISLASSQARIQLVLRNPLDKEEAKTPGTAFARLFTDQKSFSYRGPATSPARSRAPERAAAAAPKPAAKSKPEPIVVEVLIGTRKSEAKFEPATQETGTAKPGPGAL